MGVARVFKKDRRQERTNALITPNYEMLPEHCRAGMKRYIENGVIPGSFLQAVICNDLVGAFSLADSINSERLKDYAHFLYNEIPSPAWRSKEKMKAWAEARRMEAE